MCFILNSSIFNLFSPCLQLYYMRILQYQAGDKGKQKASLQLIINWDYGIRSHRRIQKLLMLCSFCPICGNKHMPGPCAADPVLFTFVAAGHKSFLVGSWSGWLKKEEMWEKNGRFELELHLLPGRYEYKYLVDGAWCHNPKDLTCVNESGHTNNYLQVYPKSSMLEPSQNGKCRIFSHIVNDNLHILGSWDNWTSSLPMMRRHNSLHKKDQCFTEISLKPGNAYEFKFKIGSSYLYDEQLHHREDGFGGFNNVIYVKPPLARPISFTTVKWLKKAFPGTAEIYGHSFSHIGQHFYIYGGIEGGKFTNTLYKLDTTSNELSIISLDGEQRAYHAYAEYGGKLLYYAGVNWNNYLRDYCTFNIANNTWSTQAIPTPIISDKTPRAMEKFSCCIMGANLIIFGGYYCHGDLEYEGNYNDVFVLNLGTMEWESPAISGSRPEKRCSHAAKVVGETMFVFGGAKMATIPVYFNDVWALDLNESAWEELKLGGAPPEPRSGHSMEPIGHFLCVFGGKNIKKVFNDVYLLDTRAWQWHRPDVIGDAPKPRYEHASASLSPSQIVIFGGRSRQPANHIYYLSLE